MKKHSVTVGSDIKKEQIIINNRSLKDINYTYKSRFDDSLSSNPGEHMAAAHAGSFSMKLSNNLSEAGYFPDRLETTCDIVVVNGIITKSILTLTARINNISEHTFKEMAYNTLDTCPISMALNVEIVLHVNLEQDTEIINRLMDAELVY